MASEMLSGTLSWHLCHQVLTNTLFYGLYSQRDLLARLVYHFYRVKLAVQRFKFEIVSRKI